MSANSKIDNINAICININMKVITPGYMSMVFIYAGVMPLR